MVEEAPNLSGVHPTSMSYVSRVYIWAHPYTVRPEEVEGRFWKNGVWLSSSDVVMSRFKVEAQNLLGVHPTSMLYVYRVFYHLDMLWMGR